MFNDVFSSLIGGIGLLFIALKILEASMRDLTGGYVRTIIKKHTSNNFQAGFWGGLMGLVAGDPAVVGFIAATLFSCKSMTLPRAMVMSIWSNVGSCCLFFLVFIDIDLIVLYMIGVTGFAFYLEKPFHWRHLIGVFFAISLMLYSLTLMKAQSENLVHIPWINDKLHELQSSYFQPFIITALLTIIIQADIVILVLIANLTQAKVLTPDQAFFMLFGMHLGLATINLLVSLNIRGVMRQIISVQVLVDTLIAVFFSIVFAIELYTGIPLIKALTTSVSDNIWTQLIFLVFFANIFMSLCFTFTMKYISIVMNVLFPVRAVVDPGTPKYIGECSIADPESSLDLINHELLDLVKRMPENIEYKLNNLNKDTTRDVLKQRHNQFYSVMNEIERLVHELGSKHCSDETADKLIAMTDRIQIIISLEEGIYHLTKLDFPPDLPEGLHNLGLEIYEAQEALLETVIEAVETSSDEDVNALINATANIDPTIDLIRQNYLKHDSHASVLSKAVILNMTSLFERNVWLMRRLSNQHIPKHLLAANTAKKGVVA